MLVASDACHTDMNSTQVDSSWLKTLRTEDFTEMSCCKELLAGFLTWRSGEQSWASKCWEQLMVAGCSCIMHWFVTEIMLEVFRCCCSPKKMLVTITFTVLQLKLKTKNFNIPASATLSLSLRLLDLPCHVNWQRSAAPFMSQNTRIQWSDKTHPMDERAYDQWPDPTRPDPIYICIAHIFDWIDEGAFTMLGREASTRYCLTSSSCQPPHKSLKKWMSDMALHAITSVEIIPQHGLVNA